jgi:LPS export ABC transporter protein LptC
MIQRRNYIWLVPLALFVTFPAWRIPVGAFLTPRVTYENPRNTDPKSQNFNMETVRILQNKDGRITAEVRAEQAFTTGTPNEYTLNNVDADLFNSAGEPTAVVADKGIFNGDSQQLTLMDNVIITKASDDQRLYTDLFHYDDRKQLVNSPGPTKIVGKSFEINGIGLDHDIVKGTYELGGRVRCTIIGSISH